MNRILEYYFSFIEHLYMFKLNIIVNFLSYFQPDEVSEDTPSEVSKSPLHYFLYLFITFV